MTSAATRPRRFELGLVILVALVVLLPGIWRYSLVDPWETHYGEVARMMLQQHDWVHMEWPQDGEGFRSKPILQFWMMAASLRANGVATNGGYSGEMIDDGGRTMFAIRLPFVLSAIAGLTLMWWMLARLVDRRLAWLALLVVGSCPFYCLVARQAMPDMPLVACVMGAIAMFTMAVEDGDAPITTLWTLRGVRIDARHVLFAIAGGFIVVQALYYAGYFLPAQGLAIPQIHHLVPAIVLPAVMLLGLAAQWSGLWSLARYPLLPVAYLIRAIAFPILWATGHGWAQTAAIAERLLHVAPITRMRQVYLLWFYWLLGVSILAKGPPGLAVVGLVAFFHVALLNRWRALYEGAFELKRGLILLVVTFLPWHIAMWLKDGNHFIDEYLFMHILNRATVGVDNSPGTFEYYTSQIGYGMWLWAALVPAAIAGAFLKARLDSRAGRVRFMIALWAISGVAFFALVQTKFHHYILPAVPALAILVAFFLDDLLAKRDRLHPLLAAIGVAIVLLVARDLMFEPKRWVEMFVFLYNRPWPSGDPWFIDPSDGFLALGIVAAVAIVALAVARRIGVVCVGAAAIAISLWALHVYMPLAGKHWGMRDALATYYHQRSIYGAKHVYYGGRDLYDDWNDHGDRWRYDTMVPDTLQVGQPMTITVQLVNAKSETEGVYQLVGTATDIGAHDIEITLAPGERARLGAAIAKGKDGTRGRPPVRVIDADKLIAWQLYWRGENFWSADEIVGPIPEMRTAFKNADNAEVMKYLRDRTLAPLGRRYFAVGTAGQIPSMRAILPTQRGKDTFEIIDTTSNKFSMAAFELVSALLDACRAAPDDDAPRLVLADALGGERGEFIVIQCALARGGLAPAESAALRRRQRELVATHGVAWSGLALLAKTVAFRRGFVDSTMIDAAVLADRADEVFAAAPLLRHVALTGLGAVGRTPGPDPLPVLRAALEHLAGIAGLHVDSIGDLLETGVTGSPYTFASVETEGFALVLASGVLASARSLSLPQVPSPTVAALVGSGQLAGITRFASANGTASTFALVAQMPALRALELRLERGYPAVFPPLEELRVADLTDDALAALAASPAAATLERLSLRNVRVDRGLAALAKLPRLRALRIEPSPQVHHHIDLASMLATERFPALRELACVELAVPAAFAIATSLGPQLELFDLRGSAAELHVRRDELQSAIAGDLLTGAWQPPHRLAFLGREPHEPLWDMPLVELPRILLAK